MNKLVNYKRYVGAIALLLIVILAAHVRSAGQSGQSNKPPIVEVKIDNFSFSPATITVPAGTTVRWTNRDDIPHTVVSDDQKFESKALDTDDQYSFTFAKPGTYGYFCSIHPKMTGKVVVQ